MMTHVQRFTLPGCWVLIGVVAPFGWSERSGFQSRLLGSFCSAVML